MSIAESTLPGITGDSFIGGRFVASGGDLHDVVDPSNGSTVCALRLAEPADVDAAVAAAKAAFVDWSTATPGARSAVLAELARILGERAADFAEVETRQAGKPIKLTTEFDTVADRQTRSTSGARWMITSSHTAPRERSAR